MWRGRFVCVLAGLCACGGGQTQVEPTPDRQPWRALDNTHWAWTSAVCDDGTHQLDARGFEDQLHVTALGSGMRFTHAVTMATDGCAETMVTWVSADGAAFRFSDQARVADAVDRTCVDSWPRDRSGEIQHDNDMLQVRMHRSALCGGYDIRHNYRRVNAASLDAHAVIRELVSGLILRDADVITRHFAVPASLVVPKPSREGGGYLRYEGRTAARGWFTNTVRSVAWIGARIVEITTPEAGRYLVRFEYMDSELAEPLDAQLQVTIADGEVFEAQWLFASPLLPRVEADAGTSLPADASLPDTRPL